MKFSTVASVLLVSAACASAEFEFNAAEWPSVSANRAVAADSNLTVGVDLSQIPLIPATVAARRTGCPAEGNFGKNGTCWFTCDASNCVRDTDVSSCQPGKFALTYGNSPKANVTDKILTTLKEANVTATFCMVGSKILQNPELAKQVQADGHNLCLDSWNHWPTTNLTNEQIVTDFRTSERAFERVLGVLPKYFRAPFGNVDDRVRKIAEMLGYRILLWNKSLKDGDVAEAKGAGEVEAMIEAKVAGLAADLKRPQPNGVVLLLHDSFPEAAELTRRLLPVITSNYTTATIGECTNDDEPVRRISSLTKASVTPVKQKEVQKSEEDSAAATVSSSAAFAFVAVAAAFSQL